MINYLATDKEFKNTQKSEWHRNIVTEFSKQLKRLGFIISRGYEKTIKIMVSIKKNNYLLTTSKSHLQPCQNFCLVHALLIEKYDSLKISFSYHMQLDLNIF